MSWMSHLRLVLYVAPVMMNNVPLFTSGAVYSFSFFDILGFPWNYAYPLILFVCFILEIINQVFDKLWMRQLRDRLFYSSMILAVLSIAFAPVQLKGASLEMSGFGVFAYVVVGFMATAFSGKQKDQQLG